MKAYQKIAIGFVVGREHCCIDIHNALEPCELISSGILHSYTSTFTEVHGKYMPVEEAIGQARIYISPQILSLPRCSDGPSNILVANAEPSNWQNNKHHVCVHYTFCTIPGEVKSTSYSIVGFILQTS